MSSSPAAVTVHRSVLAEQSPVPSAQRPAREGTLVVLPESKRSAAFGEEYVARLQEAGATLEDAVSPRTTGIIWRDHTPGELALLERLLRENDQIKWIQVRSFAFCLECGCMS